MGRNEPPTVSSELRRAADIFNAADCPNPHGDAEALVSAALLIAPALLSAHADDVVPPGFAALLGGWITRRSHREPLDYILRRSYFRGLALFVDPRALLPQEPSGPLVEVAVALPPGSRVIDVGTGCGAIALAIKTEAPHLKVSGSDISPQAIEVARENAARLRLDVDFIVAPGVPAGDYDLVVANPPYQSEDGTAFPDTPEARYKPIIAMVGGNEGTETLREFLSGVPAGVKAVLQHAPSQTGLVHSLLAEPRPVAPPTYDRAFTQGISTPHLLEPG